MGFWALWAVVLLFQNFAFTFVSRARNSGSLLLHLIAAFFSNAIFFIQFAFMTDTYAWAMMHGKDGLLKQIGIVLFYTVWTITGSVTAHYWALKYEKGKTAVGANKKYAQIPIEDWEKVKGALFGGTTTINTPCLK